MFSFKGPFFNEGKEGSRKFWPEAENLGIFSIEVAPLFINGPSLYVNQLELCEWDIMSIYNLLHDSTMNCVLMASAGNYYY